MQYDWHTISTKGDGSQADDTLAVAKLLIPAYLKNLRERQFDLGNHPNSTGSLVGDVLQDLARFAKDHYGDPEAVLSAWRAIEVNVLLGEDEDGVIMRRDWLDERSRLSRVRHTGMLKVMG